MFLHDNKSSHLQTVRRSLSPAHSASRGAMFPFKPQITSKSRGLAENYIKNFSDVSTLSLIYISLEAH